MAESIASPIKKLFKWARTSLIGTIVVFELFLSIPMTILGLFLNYSEGTLTFAWAIWVLYVCAVGGAVLAVVIRYAVVLPHVKRRENRTK
jgi:hypothetical protein